MRTLIASLSLCAALAAQDPPAYQAIDCASIDRRAPKTPDLIAPRFALFVLDLAGTHRVWMVADKSEARAEFHDILYVDLDGDGDLTRKEERFIGKHDPKLAAAGMAMTIRVGDLPVPGTDLVHKAFLVSTSPKAGRDGFWFRMKWNGKVEMSGGYGPKGIDTTRWGETAATAPVFRPCPEGPLDFGTWGDATLELKAGSAIHLNVIVGNRGGGADTLAVVDEHFLDLVAEELTVTVIAKDRAGRTVTATSRIQEHC